MQRTKLVCQVLIKATLLLLLLLLFAVESWAQGGTLKWKFSPLTMFGTDPILSSPAVGSDGVIYAGFHLNLYLPPPSLGIFITPRFVR